MGAVRASQSENERGGWISPAKTTETTPDSKVTGNGSWHFRYARPEGYKVLRCSSRGSCGRNPFSFDSSLARTSPVLAKPSSAERLQAQLPISARGRWSFVSNAHLTRLNSRRTACGFPGSREGDGRGRSLGRGSPRRWDYCAKKPLCHGPLLPGPSGASAPGTLKAKFALKLGVGPKTPRSRLGERSLLCCPSGPALLAGLRRCLGFSPPFLLPSLPPHSPLNAFFGRPLRCAEGTGKEAGREPRGCRRRVDRTAPRMGEGVVPASGRCCAAAPATFGAICPPSPARG